MNVAQYPVHMILEKIGVSTVDYWSLDTEETEADILENTRFDKFELGAITVEKERLGQTSKNGRIIKVLSKQGFEYVGSHREDAFWVSPNYFKSRGLPVPTKSSLKGLSGCSIKGCWAR